MSDALYPAAIVVARQWLVRTADRLGLEPSLTREQRALYDEAVAKMLCGVLAEYARLLLENESLEKPIDSQKAK